MSAKGVGFRSKLQSSPLAHTFRDVILLPGYSEVEPPDVELRTRASRRYWIPLPFMSSPMDTVTEAKLAIELAKSGGLGVLHRNCSVEKQVGMAREVKQHPLDGCEGASTDGEERLLCAAAISPFDLERAKKLDKYVDILVVDVAHFYTEKCMEAAKKLLREVEADVVVGNVGTYEAAADILYKLDGVAGFRVGIGSGSICLTMDSLRVGAPTLFSTAQVADAVAELGADVPVIADGGIGSAGEAALALAAGASAVMMGRVFAQCEEAAGESISVDGKVWRRYRGMASPSAKALRHAIDRYQPVKKVFEGIEGWVLVKGPVRHVVEELAEGLRAIMGYVGAPNIPSMWEKARFALISESGWSEVAPHGVLQEPR